ncbi:MAG: MFS transporter [Herpetosiphon sp.]
MSILPHPQSRSALTGSSIPINDRREIFGWLAYDWAYHAFTTTVAAALLGPYLTTLAQSAVGDNGVVLGLGPFGAVTAKSFFPFCLSLSVFLQVFFLPVLGAIADYTNLKKRLLALFSFISIAAVCLLFFVEGQRYLVGGLLFVIANLSFGAAVVFYNAFLNDICTEDQRDKVSSRGYAAGYIGGGVLLAVNLGMVLGAPRLGLAPGLAIRLSLLSAGLWWLGFALFAFARLKTRDAATHLPPGTNYLTVGFRGLWSTFRELRRLPQTLRYLGGYMLFNDGIQTVISLAPVFLAQELFVAKGLSAGESQAFVIQILLLVQFVAFFGALLFERIARWIGTKWAIVLALVIWCGIVIYAYGFLQTTREALGMAAVIAVVLGGSQALSRSLFSRMIPAGRESAYYGIYEISEGGTSWIGPLLFGIVVGATGSYRQAILYLIVLLVAGMAILIVTNTDKAVHDAGNRLPEEAATGRSLAVEAGSSAA